MNVKVLEMFHDHFVGEMIDSGEKVNVYLEMLPFGKDIELGDIMDCEIHNKLLFAKSTVSYAIIVN